MNINTTLGVVAISRNEETDLPGFFANLLPWVDEIIIVDDGSSDSTKEIASAAGEKVKVISHPMSEDGFAGQRNVGIEAATSDWLLNMDIDERVTPELACEIREKIANTKLNAFSYHRQNFFMHRPMKAGGWNSWNNPQLARREYHSYVNKVHERCVVDGEPESIGQLNNLMWHLNDESYKERMIKSLQYCQLEADKMLVENKKINALQIVVHPILEFIKKYFLKKGFLDGIPGLISAMHSADAVFRACALTWDQQHKIPREELEKRMSDLWERPKAE